MAAPNARCEMYGIGRTIAALATIPSSVSGNGKSRAVRLRKYRAIMASESQPTHSAQVRKYRSRMRSRVASRLGFCSPSLIGGHYRRGLGSALPELFDFFFDLMHLVHCLDCHAK